MQRQTQRLADEEFDLIVVGAGVHGACVARDAALRGLKVALVDKGDICGSTSHNSLKTIHGGIRYLQHLNFKRTLESINEQKYWLRTAPDLVKPLPFMMPTYGHGSRGKEAMWAGIRLYETLGFGRNRSLPANRKIPKGQIIPTEQCLQLAPGVDANGLTGGAIWYDAQVEDADRAVLQLAKDAFNHGACVANYVAAKQLVTEKKRVVGLQAQDRLSGETFTIKGQVIVNATGPWAGQWTRENQSSLAKPLSLPLTKSMNIVTRQLLPDYAIGVKSQRASDSVVGDTKRLYFIVPWRDCSIIGTTHFHHNGSIDNWQDDTETTQREIQQFIDEINIAYPPAKLTLDDVHYCYQGLTPANEPGQHENATRLHHSKVIDHKSRDGIDGLISIVSIKWTTARLVAKQATDLAAGKLGNTTRCKTHQTPLPHDELTDLHSQSDGAAIRDFCDVAIKHDMAVSLADLLTRRTDALMRGKLTAEQIATAGRYMATALNWDNIECDAQWQKLQKLWLAPDLRQQLTNLNIRS